MANFIQPEEILRHIDVQPGMHIADFGAGSGFFTILLAKRVGDSGKITALDVQKDYLEAIRAKAKQENIFNIETVWADLELPQGSKLENNSQDMVFLANVLFQAENKITILREALRILRTEGELVVIEWKLEDPPPGPPRSLRIDKPLLAHQCESVGFLVSKELHAGSHHYGFVFKK